MQDGAAASEAAAETGLQRGQEHQAASAAARASGRASLDRAALSLSLATRACRADARLARALAAVASASSPSLAAVASALQTAARTVRAPLEAVLAAADGGWALRPTYDHTAAAAGSDEAPLAAPFEWRWEAVMGAEGGVFAPQPIDDVRRCGPHPSSFLFFFLVCFLTLLFLSIFNRLAFAAPWIRRCPTP